jgi:RNA polymerase sigma factor (sigma-70 family)
VSIPNTSQRSEPLAVKDQTGWFAETIQPHDLALRRYLRSRFPSIDAEDVVQESYFRLFKARAKGKFAFSKAYVFAIARNTARTLLHRRRIYSSTELADLPDPAVLEEKSDVSDRVNDQLRFQLALEAIDQLPPRCREIFRLAALDHLPTAEIVRRTGLAENTVYAQLAIGVRKCSEFLRERGERT